MKYRVHGEFADGMASDPGFTVTVAEVRDLTKIVVEELCNDYGVPLGPGFSLTIERVE